MKVKIYFTDQQEKQKKLEAGIELTSLLRRAVITTLKYEKFPHDAEISISFVDNGAIRVLNRDYRNIDKETDVLSFPMISSANEINVINTIEPQNYPEAVVLGDIVLSLEKASEQAEEFGHSLEREAAFLCVHSMLHLLGYDHETSDADDKLMRYKQREIIKRIRMG